MRVPCSSKINSLCYSDQSMQTTRLWLQWSLGSLSWKTKFIEVEFYFTQRGEHCFTWSICLRLFIALSNSSTMVFRAGLAPAAHWSRWEIRNCWLLILSRTLVSDITICSDRTWVSEGVRVERWWWVRVWGGKVMASEGGRVGGWWWVRIRWWDGGV